MAMYIYTSNKQKMILDHMCNFAKEASIMYHQALLGNGLKSIARCFGTTALITEQELRDGLV